MKYYNPNHPIIRAQFAYFIKFEKNHSKFNECFNLIMEHATGLFTPGSLLYYIKQKLHDKQFLEISYKELCEHLSINSHKNFKNAVKKLPANYKYRNGTTKYILKKALEGYIPKQIIYRKKKGFGMPIGKWFAQKEISMNMKLQKVSLE